MLYDGLLQRLRQSKLCIEDNRLDRAGELLGNAHDILAELMSSLDPEKSPELAENLLRLYIYCKERLIVALGERNPEYIDEVLGLLQPMRDAWSEAERSLRDEKPQAVGE
jgi:flagellar protein FliS